MTTKSTSTRSLTHREKNKRGLCKIHVSQPAIRANLKKARSGEEGYEPVITVKRGKDNIYGHEVIIRDNDGNIVARVIQPKDEKLSCGARVWIEAQDVNVEIREHKEDHDVVTDFQ